MLFTALSSRATWMRHFIFRVAVRLCKFAALFQDTCGGTCDLVCSHVFKRTAYAGTRTKLHHQAPILCLLDLKVSSLCDIAEQSLTVGFTFTLIFTMEVDALELANFRRVKNTYKLFCVGCVIFTVGFLFIFFGRPYTFDRTNKDLFLPFGLLFLIPGCGVIFGASYLLIRQWRESNDFARLNRLLAYQKEDAAEDLKSHSELLSNQEALPAYSQLGINLNEPI